MTNEKSARLAEVERIAREVAASLGLEVVEFAFHSRGRHSLLRIDVDRPGMPGAGLSDCEALSRALDAPLDSLAFFEAPYELQVSTPGLDRPIRSDDDRRRNAGRPVRLEYRDDNGRVREISGTLAGSAPRGSVRVVVPTGDLVVAQERILLMKQTVTVPKGARRKR